MTSTERCALIDELGQIEQDIAKVADKAKRATEIRAEIRTWFPKLAATRNTTENGFKFLVTVGPRDNETAINSMREVFDAVGEDTFLSTCSYTLKALKENVTPDDVIALTTTTRTGSRPIKTFAIARGK